MTLDDFAREAAAIALTSKAYVVGGAAGLLAWAMSLNWLGLGSVVIAALGLGANIYFLWRRDRREERELASRLRLNKLESDALRREQRSA